MKKYIAFDTETHLIQAGLLAPNLVCGSTARRHQGSQRIGSARLTRKWFGLAIRNPEVHIIGANIAYDLGVMCADDPTLIEPVFEAAEAGRLHDVSIRESLLEIARGTLGVDAKTGRKLDDDEGAKYSLAMLVERYLGMDISSSKAGPDSYRLRYATLEKIPIARWPEAARIYPKNDARFTMDVFQAQEKAAQDTYNDGNLHDEPRSVYNAWVLHLISLWGLRTSEELVAALDAKVSEKHRLAEIRFKEAGIVRADGTEDRTKIKALVTAAYNGAPPTTNKGGVATDRDTKIESGDPLLIEHAVSGKNNRYRTTYLPQLWKGTKVPINPAFYGMAATTRVTSNYQQLPQKGGVRECHVCRPGFVYCSVDYGGLELRTMSQRAIWEPRVGYSKMADALLKGLDVHTVAAAEFLGVSYESLLARVKAKEDLADSFRKLAKIFNFGKGGGMGDNTLAFHARAKDGVRFCQLAKRIESCGAEGMLDIKIRGQDKQVCRVCGEVSQELGNRWLDAWTEQKELKALAQNAPDVVTIPVVNIMRTQVGYTQWLNTPFQGLGAVLTTQAMRKISREMYTDRNSPLWGSRLVLNVHDELIGELREDVMNGAAERMAFLMRQAGKECLPDLAPAIEAEPVLMRVMSKDAEVVRDAAGKLIPWEPKAVA